MEHLNKAEDITDICDTAVEFYLPKPLMMLIGTYMKDYELSKMMQACTYFNTCA